MSRSETSAPVALYTDGSCAGNPGPGGWAALLIWGGRELLRSGAAAATTNNRMELSACIEGLQALTRPSAVDLHSDSQYVIRGINEWLPAWRARGWRTAAGKPVLNQDLWEQLAAVAAEHRVRWQWVKGHSGHPQNERVDAAARAAIGQLRPKVDCA